MKLLIMKCSASSCYSSLLDPNVLLGTLCQLDFKSRSFVLRVFEHLQFTVCSQSNSPSYTQEA